MLIEQKKRILLIIGKILSWNIRNPEAQPQVSSSGTSEPGRARTLRTSQCFLG